MKKYQLLLAFAVLSLTIFNACKNEADPHEGDVTDPELTIENPTANAIIQGAVEIHLEAKDESLHEMEIRVT